MLTIFLILCYWKSLHLSKLKFLSSSKIKHLSCHFTWKSQKFLLCNYEFLLHKIKNFLWIKNIILISNCYIFAIYLSFSKQNMVRFFANLKWNHPNITLSNLENNRVPYFLPSYWFLIKKPLKWIGKYLKNPLCTKDLIKIFARNTNGKK